MYIYSLLTLLYRQYSYGEHNRWKIDCMIHDIVKLVQFNSLGVRSIGWGNRMPFLVLGFKL